ncbi:hypothetical protein Bca52824_029626 [Brassica carinata]|uniref:Uncharacterized protein n=1 Tax=Brassica carinata TaxID=52824 RepID=A0A8X8ARX7_BRACI|nr:hypothetical protein Bca52824_029626 [Brassica carinata]
MMQKLGDFNHVLQPVRDTREKQIQLWKELILIGVEDSPLFSNSAIDRTLSHEARETLIMSAIVGEGLAEWLDKGHRKCLIGQTSFFVLILVCLAAAFLHMNPPAVGTNEMWKARELESERLKETTEEAGLLQEIPSQVQEKVRERLITVQGSVSLTRTRISITLPSIAISSDLPTRTSLLKYCLPLSPVTLFLHLPMRMSFLVTALKLVLQTMLLLIVLVSFWLAVSFRCLIWMLSTRATLRPLEKTTLLSRLTPEGHSVLFSMLDLL